MNLPDPKTKAGRDCVILLDQFRSKKMNRNDFYYTAVLIGLEHIDLLRCQSEPFRPRELIELDDMRKSDEWRKKKYDEKMKTVNRIYSMMSVDGYINDRNEIRGENASNRVWLEHCYRVLKFFKDEPRLNIVKKTLLTFGVDKDKEEYNERS